MGRALRPQQVTVRAPLPLEMRVALALHKLGGCAEYGVVAERFGVHKSTAKKFVYAFCRGLVSSVIRGLVRAPTPDEARAAARRFERAHRLPQVMGCVARTHVPVSPPTDGHGDFVNAEGWTSHVLQAVVDDEYRFWNINCKFPGRTHDANVLRQSTLFEKAQELPKSLREIQGKSVRLFLLGDPAYPLLDWLIKGYNHSPGITAEQESFNVYMSSARTAVKIAFGRLKSRWRVLLKHSHFHHTFTPHVVATCCALHNFCKKEKDIVNPIWVEEATVLSRDFPQPGVCENTTADTAGQSVRQALTEYMALNFPLLTVGDICKTTESTFPVA